MSGQLLGIVDYVNQKHLTPCLSSTSWTPFLHAGAKLDAGYIGPTLDKTREARAKETKIIFACYEARLRKRNASCICINLPRYACVV